VGIYICWRPWSPGGILLPLRPFRILQQEYNHCQHVWWSWQTTLHQNNNPSHLLFPLLPPMKSHYYNNRKCSHDHETSKPDPYYKRLQFLNHITVWLLIITTINCCRILVLSPRIICWCCVTVMYHHEQITILFYPPQQDYCLFTFYLHKYFFYFSVQLTAVWLFVFKIKEVATNTGRRTFSP